MDRILKLGILPILIINIINGGTLGSPTEATSFDAETGFTVRLNLINDGIIGPNCKGQEVNASMMVNAVESCTMDKEIGKVEGVPTEKSNVRETSSLCTTACLWKKLGLVGEDMMFAQDITPFVFGTFPPNSQPDIMDAMAKCAANNKWPVSMEDNCNSYGSMRKCIMDAVVEICRGS